MKDHYDVIVVGAGPAGSMAAMTAAERGLTVLLIEKRQEIGEQVRCAEAITASGLAGFMEPEPKWISARIRTAKMFSPSGKCLEFVEPDSDVAYILERKIFDRDLARRAAKAGAEVYTKTQATGLLLDGTAVNGIVGKQLGEGFEAKARVVVAADGVESRVARWAGVNTTLRRNDLGACVQFHLVHPDLDPTCCEFHFGKRHAPGGYAWVFPKGEGEANVGLGTLIADKGYDFPIRCLEKFVAWRFPGASVLQTIVGGVPVSKVPPRISSDGLVLVGDAGRLADPATGEGILNGMISGRIAGNVIADSLERGDVSAAALRRYDDEIWKELGPVIDRNYSVKQFLVESSDTRLNLAFGAAKAMSVDRYPASKLAEEFYTTSKGAGILKLLFR